jgi:hypothetical protein
MICHTGSEPGYMYPYDSDIIRILLNMEYIMFSSNKKSLYKYPVIVL